MCKSLVTFLLLPLSLSAGAGSITLNDASLTIEFPKIGEFKSLPNTTAYIGEVIYIGKADGGYAITALAFPVQQNSTSSLCAVDLAEDRKGWATNATKSSGLFAINKSAKAIVYITSHGKINIIHGSVYTRLNENQCVEVNISKQSDNATNDKEIFEQFKWVNVNHK